jgi:hypothetical protein
VTTAEPATQVWRLAGFGRGIATVVAAGPALMAAVLWVQAAWRLSAEGALEALTLTGIAVVYGLFVWWMFLRPKLVLTDDEVVVVNPWGTTRVPLADVVGLSGGYMGAYLQLRDGWSVRIFALAEAYGGGLRRGRRVAEAADAVAHRKRLRAPQPPAARG